MLLIARALILSLLLEGGLFAEARSKPAVHISFPNRKYNHTVKSLRAMDFRNFQYRSDGRTIRLRKGEFKSETSDHVRTEISLVDVWFFGDEGQDQKALVALDDFSASGSSTDWQVLQVFKLRNGYPTVVQELSFDLQAPGTGAEFDVESGALVIRARSDDNSAHCCPENVDIARFQWERNRFGLKSYKKVALPNH